MRTIIQTYYSEMRNGKTLFTIGSKIQMAAFILADIYNLYETSKEKELLSEFRFFLGISNPIKHIVNILNNCGDSGTMSIDDAILEEYKIINGMNDLKLAKISLLKIIEEVIHNHSFSNHILEINKEHIINEIITKLNENRVLGKLDEDTRNFILCNDHREMIYRIIERRMLGEDLMNIILDMYNYITKRSLSHNNHENISIAVESAISKVKSELISIIEENINQVHNHLDHVGSSTFNELQTIKPIIDEMTVYDDRRSSSYNNGNYEREKHGREHSRGTSKNNRRGVPSLFDD